MVFISYVLILVWSSMTIFKLFILLCITGYFYEVLSACTQLHICALTSVNKIKIFKNECVMSVNLSLSFYSLISVRHFIYAWGILCSSSCSHATGQYYPRPRIIWVFKTCLYMYVWQISFNRDLTCVKDSTYTGQTQTQRKFRHTFIPWVEFGPVQEGCSGRIRFDSCSLYPQNEIGPSISSSVILCVFVLLVYIVVLV